MKDETFDRTNLMVGLCGLVSKVSILMVCDWDSIPNQKIPDYEHCNLSSFFSLDEHIIF